MKYFCLLCVCVVVNSMSIIAQQQSDFAIVQKFQSSIKAVTKSIEIATTAQECADISNRLDGMEKEFEESKKLLDNALYPDNYSTVMTDLRGRLLVRQRDLGIIETQVTRIAELETRVKELSNQLAVLNGQNEKLMADVQRLSTNVQKLTGDLFTSGTPLDSLRTLIVQLRKGLQDRDALIISLVDSLFLQYDKNVTEMKDVEKKGLMGRVEHYNILANIKRSVQDNIAYLEATNLKGTDMLSIVKQQQRFNSLWSGISPKLAELYLTGKQKKNDMALVDSMLVQWKNKIDASTWRSLNALFREKVYGVKEFTSGDEFVANLSAFIDLQFKNPDHETKETLYKIFTNFSENVWKSDLSPAWLPALVETQKITDAQKKEIEAKIELWQSRVEPGNSWLIYILIFVAIVIIGAVAYWWMNKKKQIGKQLEVKQ